MPASRPSRTELRRAPAPIRSRHSPIPPGAKAGKRSAIGPGPNTTWPIRALCMVYVSETAEVDPRRSSLQRGGLRGRAGSDFGWWLGGQIQLQFVQQEVELGFG